MILDSVLYPKTVTIDANREKPSKYFLRRTPVRRSKRNHSGSDALYSVTAGCNREDPINRKDSRTVVLREILCDPEGSSGDQNLNRPHSMWKLLDSSTNKCLQVRPSMLFADEVLFYGRV